jgi:hypothetical protein
MVLPIAYGLGALALRAAPFALRAGKALIKPSNIKNYFAGTARPFQGALNKGATKGLGYAGRTRPGMFKYGPYGSNLAFTSAAPFAGMAGYDYLTGDAEQSVADGQRTVPSPATPGGPAGMTIEEGEKAGIIKDKKEKPDDAKMTSDQIKSGELDDFIKERIDLFEKYIGDDTRKRTKTAGYNAMVQFGLNLATKRGNLVEGIAESAKEPLKEFAKLGNDLMDRAASIKKAGIESGVSAYDKAKDREIDEKAIAADILQEKIKANARELDAGKFYAATYQDIMGNQDTLDGILAQNYEADGRTLKPNPVPEKQLIDNYIGQLYQSYNAVELPPGTAGDELYDSLPSGTRYFDSESGVYNTKP